MYNSELKTKFIQSYTKSINTAAVATTIFDAFEQYEQNWGADLCTKSIKDLQPVIDKIVGLRLKSQWMSLIILKEYGAWCVAMKVPGACDGVCKITVAGIDKVRRQMIANPVHLQRYLNEIFDKESEDTIDILYRCYYWMAFAGIKESDVVEITDAEVDFTQLEIHHDTENYPIYRESVTAFQKAVGLKSFAYKHPNYNSVITRDRVSGNSIMRGVKAQTKIMTIRAVMSHKSAEAIAAGKTEHQLSFNRIWLSGLFYRMREREQAGIPVDFSEATIEFMKDRKYTIGDKSKLIYKQNRIEKEYMEDYQRWKMAFSM